MQASATPARVPMSLWVLDGLVHLALAAAVILPVAILSTDGGLTSIEAQLVRTPGLTEPSLLFDAYPVVRSITAKVAVGDEHRGTARMALLVLAGLAVFSLWQLRGITRSACKGTQFKVQNARRLRRMGWAAIVLTCAMPFLAAQASNALQTVEIPGVAARLTHHFEPSFPMYALVLFALASIFERGAALSE